MVEPRSPGAVLIILPQIYLIKNHINAFKIRTYKISRELFYRLLAFSKFDILFRTLLSFWSCQR